MKYIRYSTMPVKEIEPNVCYFNDLCSKRKRRECEKEGTCQVDLCYRDKERLAKISNYDNKPHTLKIEKAVAKFRKAEFKKCRAILFEIMELKK